jgi:hypothetical protein
MDDWLTGISLKLFYYTGKRSAFVPFQAKPKNIKLIKGALRILSQSATDVK